jgi:hypothetical protein
MVTVRTTAGDMQEQIQLGGCGTSEFHLIGVTHVNIRKPLSTKGTKVTKVTK